MTTPDFIKLPSPLQLLDGDFLGAGVELFIKRDDLIHPWINGNKWRKLCLNVSHSKFGSPDALISFGGAFSNHLVAVASYCYEMNIRSVGLVRSYHEEISNPTIDLLRDMNMELHFVNPNEYKLKEKHPVISNLLLQYSSCIIIPEGGTNLQGAQGALMIMNEVHDQTGIDFTHIAVALGTGGTLAGIVNGAKPNVQIIAFSPFKGALHSLAGFVYIKNDEADICYKEASKNKRFGSYDGAIVAYINDFYERYQILLEPVYTAKAMLNLEEMIERGELERGAKVLFIHTGGLQGIMGYNYLYADRPQINIPTSYRFLHKPLITLGKK